MGYPGDQSQPGGWPPEQPSQSPSPYQSAGSGELGAPFDGPGPYGEPPTGSYEGHRDSRYGADHNPGYASGYNTDHNVGHQADYTVDHGAGYDADDPNRGAPMPPARSKLPLIIGGIVGAVVLVGGGIMVVSFLGGDSGKKTVADTTAPALASPQSSVASKAPSTPAAKPTTGPLGAKLKSRSSDPRPLTLAEVFKHRKFGKYVMVVQRQDAHCAKVVHGAKFAAALKSGGCTQLLRATFRTTDGRLIGTVGVANLKTETEAKKVRRAGGGKDAWMLPLPGSGSTKKIGKGSALGTAEARGHYLLLSWVQHPDGKQLAAGEQSLVSRFVTQVFLGSNLTTALQYRGISGKPYGT